MGAWDMLSDDDPRAVGHKEPSCNCKTLSEYSKDQLINELRRRNKVDVKAREDLILKRESIKKELKKLSEAKIELTKELSKLGKR
jgi:hypothetical protein